jgi:hypothetical protein
MMIAHRPIRFFALYLASLLISHTLAHARDITDEEFIGIDIGQITDNARSFYNIPNNKTCCPNRTPRTISSSIITAVHPGTQAQAAGLQPGDVILSLMVIADSRYSIIQNSYTQAGPTLDFEDPTVSEIAQLLQHGRDAQAWEAIFFIYRPRLSKTFSFWLQYPVGYTVATQDIPPAQKEWLVYHSLPRWFSLDLSTQMAILFGSALFLLISYLSFRSLTNDLNRTQSASKASEEKASSNSAPEAPADLIGETSSQERPSADDATPSEISLPAVVPPPTESLTPMPPAQGMALKLKRSQKQSTFGAIIYILDARMDVSAEVRDQIYKHRLGNRLVYESEARQKHRANALGHAADSADAASDVGLVPTPGQIGKGLLKTTWKLGRAGVSAARASMALRITIDSLIAGVHVECKSMEELLDAEDAIRQAAENLKGYVEVAKTFDGGEEIVEF